MVCEEEEGGLRPLARCPREPTWSRPRWREHGRARGLRHGPIRLWATVAAPARGEGRGQGPPGPKRAGRDAQTPARPRTAAGRRPGRGRRAAPGLGDTAGPAGAEAVAPLSGTGEKGRGGPGLPPPPPSPPSLTLPSLPPSPPPPHHCHGHCPITATATTPRPSQEPPSGQGSPPGDPHQVLVVLTRCPHPRRPHGGCSALLRGPGHPRSRHPAPPAPAPGSRVGVPGWGGGAGVGPRRCCVCRSLHVPRAGFSFGFEKQQRRNPPRRVPGPAAGTGCFLPPALFVPGTLDPFYKPNI